MPVSQNIYAQYRPIYDQFMLEYVKKLQIIKKLSYNNLYEDRVRINYDEEIKKFEEFKIKLFSHPIFGMKILNNNHNNICLSAQ